MSSRLSGLPIRAAVAYAAAGTAWILASDSALHLLPASAPDFLRWGTLKGLAFVLVTALVLHAVLQRVVRRVEEVEHALRESDARWRQALSGVGDGVWEARPDGTATFFSTEWKRMLGYAEHEISLDQQEWWSRIHPEETALVRAAMDRFLRGETIHYRCEYRMRGKDGTYRWILARGGWVGEPHAAGSRLIGTHTDITSHKQSEAELLSAAERYRALFVLSPNPMWIYELSTLRFLAVNEAAIQHYGYSREEFLNLTLRDIRPPEEVAGLMANVKTSGTGPQVSGPWKHRRKDGTVLDVEINSSPIRWQEHEARVVVAKDVTAARHAQEALAASEQKFRRVFNAASDGILILDPKFRVLDCNRRAEEMFGLDLDGLNRRRAWTIAPEYQPDGERSAEKAVRMLARSAVEDVVSFEWRIQRADGEICDTEVTGTRVPVGDCLLRLVTVRDVTAHKRDTAQLELLRAAVNASPSAWVITNHDGTIEWVNPAFTRMTGYEPGEVVGRTPRILRSGRHSPEFYADLWRTILRGEVWAGDLQNQRKDGSLYFERMIIAPVRRGSNGSITHFVAIKQDVTAERQLEQQVARSQRLESVGLLASGIAHDLNNVLTPILLSAELLKHQVPDPAAQPRFELIAQAAQRGAGIIKQVLAFARGIDGERAVVEARHLVREVGELVRETFPREIEVEVNCPRDVGVISADVTQMHQVLLNLAVNARDAMPQGGRLGLNVRNVRVEEDRARFVTHLQPGAYVEFSVTDTGTGIPDPVLDHMFDPFFTTKPRGKGTGLGLSTVYGIVRNHGGAVQVETALGKGTTFYVLIPQLPEEKAALHAAPRRTLLTAAGRRVLVVDDEAAVRQIAAQLLRLHGFEVELAVDGQDALERFQAGPATYDLVLADLMMPRLSGAEFVRAARQVRPDLPVIGMSGLLEDPANPEESGLAVFKGAGVEHLLAKPFEPGELVEAIQAALPMLARTA